jgi:hypothetical protein
MDVTDTPSLPTEIVPLVDAVTDPVTDKLAGEEEELRPAHDIVPEAEAPAEHDELVCAVPFTDALKLITPVADAMAFMGVCDGTVCVFFLPVIIDAFSTAPEPPLLSHLLVILAPLAAANA